MSEEQDNIERFFSKYLAGKEFEFDESQWDKLEQKLDAMDWRTGMAFQEAAKNKSARSAVYRTLMVVLLTVSAFLLGWYMNAPTSKLNEEYSAPPKHTSQNETSHGYETSEAASNVSGAETSTHRTVITNSIDSTFIYNNRPLATTNYERKQHVTSNTVVDSRVIIDQEKGNDNGPSEQEQYDNQQQVNNHSIIKATSIPENGYGLQKNKVNDRGISSRNDLKHINNTLKRGTLSIDNQENKLIKEDNSATFNKREDLPVTPSITPEQTTTGENNDSEELNESFTPDKINYGPSSNLTNEEAETTDNSNGPVSSNNNKVLGQGKPLIYSNTNDHKIVTPQPETSSDALYNSENSRVNEFHSTSKKGFNTIAPPSNNTQENANKFNKENKHTQVNFNSNTYTVEDPEYIAPLGYQFDSPELVFFEIHQIELTHTSEHADSVEEKTQYRNTKTWAITAIVAPDFNSTKTSELFKSIGESYGLSVQYYPMNKLEISAGAMINRKVYTASQDECTYPSDKMWLYGISPYSTDAVCKMLDIPVSVGYKFLSYENSGFWLKAGISSYLLMTENYVFNYDVENSHLLREWNSDDRTFAFASTLNFNIAYEQKLGNNFSVLLDPYFKIPLIGLGFYSIDLLTSGVNVGLRYRIKPKSKVPINSTY